MGEGFLRVFIPSQISFFQSHVQKELLPLIHPIVKPLSIMPRLYKIFYFHLFQLSQTKQKVPRGNFVSECLSYLSDTEGHFEALRFLHQLKIHKHGLGGFRAQKSSMGNIFNRPQKCLEHQVEILWLGKIFFTARGTLILFFRFSLSRESSVHHMVSPVSRVT